MVPDRRNAGADSQRREQHHLYPAFGCLPNHIVGKGVIKELRRNYPQSNIIAVDYDPGASEVNQLNRIKLMLATAQKNLKTEISREDRGNGRRPVAAYSPCLGTMSHT